MWVSPPTRPTKQVRTVACTSPVRGFIAVVPVKPTCRAVLDGECLIAGVVTTAGTVVARVLMGQACDKFGPRYCKHRFSFPYTQELPCAMTGRAWLIMQNITNLV